MGSLTIALICYLLYFPYTTPSSTNVVLVLGATVKKI